MPQVTRWLGRYGLADELGVGGMATVYLAVLRGTRDFTRAVAVKRLHPHLARDARFRARFCDEARLAARVRHPNIVRTLDVVDDGDDVVIVMDYQHGASLAELLGAAEEARLPADVAVAVTCGVLHGLHAAHEATDENAQPLSIVHRDVSPQNILVSSDGVAHLLDFGIAKAAGRGETTGDGSVKGKLAYMAPEQLHGERVDRRADVYAVGAVLWEALTGRRLFEGAPDAVIGKRMLAEAPAPPGAIVPAVPPELDAIVLRALAPEPERRFGSARQMALALEACGLAATVTRVGSWVEETVGDLLERRARAVAAVERGSQDVLPGPADPAPGVDPPSPRAPGEETLVAPPPDGRGAARTRRALYFAGAAGLAALIAGAIALRPAPARDPAPAVAARSSASAVEAAAPPPVVEAPVAASAGARAAPAAHAPAPDRRRAAPHAPHAGSRSPCVPSFVDENGIKRYRTCP